MAKTVPAASVAALQRRRSIFAKAVEKLKQYAT
jgi:hypothetical protein